MTSLSRPLSRRRFLVASATAALASQIPALAQTEPEPIIDIHQHTNYGGKRDSGFRAISLARSDEQLIAHQRAMGVTKTILLPAGREVLSASTHQGRSNGLEGTCTSNEACMALAQRFPNEFAFGANEVSDLQEAPSTIETYLKRGAVLIGEQKFGVECDSPEMQKLYQLAAAYGVPILMHWQVGSYNYGFERFHRMLEKYPKVNFIGHAQTWWANIDKAYVDDAKNLYPRGLVTPGGLTDRYLRDYPNMFADLSAGSGANAFKRDPDQARAFITRHQDKLLYGSDCNDSFGKTEACSGSVQIAQVRAFSPSKQVERKLLYENARTLFRF
ncbi:MAG TPA: amidohydrolase family protein [Opitutaceae bacterium]|nr:amidohydrolase family protein [Opitutaceae bacterium]